MGVVSRVGRTSGGMLCGSSAASSLLSVPFLDGRRSRRKIKLEMDAMKCISDDELLKAK
jgi:hypothetical protein